MAREDSWPKVEERIRAAHTRLAHAKLEQEYPGIGHLCRDVLIALADTVHDPGRHPPTDGVVPSRTDAKRRLEAYLAAELRGSGNEAARKAARAAVDLANAVQHDDTATPQEAALAVAWTNAVVEFIGLISGHRDKPLQSIQVELVEQLAQAKADAASWKEKYEGLAGFSAHLSIED